jgi:nucleotide-binding universal stress UspA family protein
MKQPQKILFGYDGSECSNNMLEDVRRAGLPAQAEAFVLSVAEHWIVPPTSFGGVDLHFTEDPNEANRTRALAQEAQGRLSAYFPQWNIQSEAMWGTVASQLLGKADEWKPDLIVVGSHGRSLLGRVLLGSVSQKVLHEAHCSVRIARGTARAGIHPARIIIGIDGSAGANNAVDAVLARSWPQGSQVRLVNATWTVPPVTSARMVAPIADWIRQENARIQAALELATARLQGAGLSVSSVIEEEEPRQLLCKEAKDWEADCIFLGARGMGPMERLLIGSISSGVAAHAPCSVEVVRVAS